MLKRYTAWEPMQPFREVKRDWPNIQLYPSIICCFHSCYSATFLSELIQEENTCVSVNTFNTHGGPIHAIQKENCELHAK